MVNKYKWFNEPKKTRNKDLKPMELAKDALILTGGVVLLGAGAKALGELFDWDEKRKERKR